MQRRGHGREVDYPAKPNDVPDPLLGLAPRSSLLSGFELIFSGSNDSAVVGDYLVPHW